MLGFMVLFFFFYGCLEFTTISFLPTFGVKSKLALSPREATELMAYYLGPLFVMRVSAIFLESEAKTRIVLQIKLELLIAWRADRRASHLFQMAKNPL